MCICIYIYIFTSRRVMRDARRRGSGSVIAARTDWRAEDGETETVPMSAVTRGVVSSSARPNEYIHICNERRETLYTKRLFKYRQAAYNYMLLRNAYLHSWVLRYVPHSVCSDFQLRRATWCAKMRYSRRQLSYKATATIHTGTTKPGIS